MRQRDAMGDIDDSAAHDDLLGRVVVERERPRLLRGAERLLEIDRAIHEPERPQLGALARELDAVFGADRRISGDAPLELLGSQEMDRHRVLEAEVPDLGDTIGDRRDTSVPSLRVPRVRRLHCEGDDGRDESDGEGDARYDPTTVVVVARP